MYQLSGAEEGHEEPVRGFHTATVRNPRKPMHAETRHRGILIKIDANGNIIDQSTRKVFKLLAQDRVRCFNLPQGFASMERMVKTVYEDEQGLFLAPQKGSSYKLRIEKAQGLTLEVLS